MKFFWRLLLLLVGVAVLIPSNVLGALILYIFWDRIEIWLDGADDNDKVK